MKYKLPHVAVLSAGLCGGRRTGSLPRAHGFQPRRTGAGDRAADGGDKPVARVNGSVLTDADLVREEYAIFPYARQHNGLPKDLEPQIRAGALKMIVFEELVYQEALRRKMTVPAAKMQRAEADFRKQFATPEEFNAFLQSEFHGSRAVAAGEDPALAAD